MIKLTPLQWLVLLDAKDGLVYRSERGGDLYEAYDRGQRVNGRDKRVTAIVERLYGLGLLKIGDQSVMQRPWHVTEKGAQALADKESAS